MWELLRSLFHSFVIYIVTFASFLPLLYRLFAVVTVHSFPPSCQLEGWLRENTIKWEGKAEGEMCNFWEHLGYRTLADDQNAKYSWNTLAISSDFLSYLWSVAFTCISLSPSPSLFLSAHSSPVLRRPFRFSSWWVANEKKKSSLVCTCMPLFFLSLSLPLFSSCVSLSPAAFVLQPMQEEERRHK